MREIRAICGHCLAPQRPLPISYIPVDFPCEPSVSRSKDGADTIDPKTAQEGAALIATAITELSENLHEDAVRLERGDLKVVMVRVEALREAAADVATLTDAADRADRKPPAEFQLTWNELRETTDASQDAEERAWDRRTGTTPQRGDLPAPALAPGPRLTLTSDWTWRRTRASLGPLAERD